MYRQYTDRKYRYYIHSVTGDLIVSAPTDVVIQAGARSANVCWNAPTDGPPVDGYVVKYSLRDDPDVFWYLNVTSSEKHVCRVVEGLKPLTMYTADVHSEGNGVLGFAATAEFTATEDSKPIDVN